MNVTHQSKRAVYVIGGLYLAVGLALTAHGALNGSIAETLAGFLVINVVIMGGWLVLIVAGLSDRTAQATQRLERIGESLRRIEEFRTAPPPMGRAHELEASLDLTAIGSGNPSVLASAILDRSVFPRLAGSIQPPQAGEQAVTEIAPASNPQPSADRADDHQEVVPTGGPGRKNMLRSWRVGLREGDVVTCRRVLSTLLDTADPALVADFQAELDRLIKRVEGELRRRFASRVRDGDYSAAIDVGREILSRLPESPIARDYQQIEPHLIRRANDPVRSSDPTSQSRLG